MPRKRPESRLDDIVTAAAYAFAKAGYDRTKVHQIAEVAGVGPGTVYLYANDKEALFELAVLRALESPAVASPELPYRKTPPDQLRRLLEECLHSIAHFPQLWVASQRRTSGDSRREYYGILLELAEWVRRYRSAILLCERNRADWPAFGELFDEIVWDDLRRRLGSYLAARMRGAELAPWDDPRMVANFSIDAVVAAVATGASAQKGDTFDDSIVARLVAAPLVFGSSTTAVSEMAPVGTD